MSDAVRRPPAIRLGLSLALGLVGLVLTSCFNVHLEGATQIGDVIRFDGPVAPWCGPADGRASSSCHYSTFENCLDAASTDDRMCRPNPAALLMIDDEPSRTDRSVYL